VIASICVLIVFVLGFAMWWRNGLRDELVLLLQPPYRVTQIDSTQRTMTVEGVTEAFQVRCQNICGSFKVGNKYPMLYRGASLEFRRNGQRFQLEIVGIQMKPPALPGGLG
jgi:hypothetical protein